MNSSDQYVLKLEGLRCANCAIKMENEIRKINEVEKIRIDFVMKKMYLTIKAGADLPQLLDRIQWTVANIESGVQLVNVEEKHEKITKGIKEPWVLFGFALSFLVLAISGIFPFAITLFFYLLSYILVGGKIIAKSLQNIAHGRIFDENFLMTVATLGAIIIGEYPEAVAVMLFYRIGEYFQEKAVNKSRKSIKALLSLKPEQASLEKNGRLYSIHPDNVAVNEILVVKPGEKIPLDGIVVEGISTVDASALTGESLPKAIEPGSKVLAGFINHNGMLRMRVTKKYKDSTMARVINLVEHAASRKSPSENFITTFARYYSPIVVFFAIAIAIIPPIVISGALYSDWIYRALVFLVISCPCALVISIPLGVFGGIGGASKHGILIKGGNYLEALSQVKTIVFDKTGTLTTGKLHVESIIPEQGVDKDTLLELAAYGESGSNHPIAYAISKEYGKEIDRSKIIEQDETPGYGVKTVISNKEIFVGNARYMKSLGIKNDVNDYLSTAVYVAVNREYMGSILMDDKVKNDAAAAIGAIKALGVKRIAVFTGDRKVQAERIGQEIGIMEIYAELLPDDKVYKLEEIILEQNNKGKVAFVGDGINDAPVLARGDIGIAMGGIGSDAAIEAADVVLMDDDLHKIAMGMKIAKRTQKIIWQNIVFALGVKFIFLLLGALGIISMWEAVFADVGVTLLAIANSVRALNTRSIKKMAAF